MRGSEKELERIERRKTIIRGYRQQKFYFQFKKKVSVPLSCFVKFIVRKLFSFNYVV